MSFRLVVGLLPLLLAPLAFGADPSSAASEQVRARLVAESLSVQPGHTLQLGVQQRIAPHWHTYWRNPGDSGLATKIAWQLPEGAKAGEIAWPLPRRFDVGGIINYGYADETTLLTTVQVPATLKAGERFQVQATVDWLVCRESCIPQQVVLALSLPVRDGPPAAGPDAPLLQAAKAQVPGPAPWPVQWQGSGDQVTLHWAGTERAQASFFPATWGQVSPSAPQVLSQRGERALLRLSAGDAPPAADAVLDGVLVLKGADGAARAYEVRAVAQPLPGPAPAREDGPAPDLFIALLLAFAGGFVLNAMPCVFPVLSIKALGLLQHAAQSRRVAVSHGVAYTAGVLASFLLLAAGLIALRAGGEQIGWGFQFQSPVFVLATAWLMLALGLNLSGVYAVGGSLAGVGDRLAGRDGRSGSFFTGVLATVVASPCTAPFMGGAVGYALAQPAVVTLAVFAALGLGLASPYLVLSAWPALQRALPRPGAWMERLKQGLAFPLYGAAAWLVWVLAQQGGADAVAIALGGAVLLGLAAWALGSVSASGSTGARRWAAVTAAGVLALLAGGAASLRPGEATAAPVEAGWQPYTPERLQALRAEGRPVFVNLTAAWCLTCLVNERVALARPDLQAAFDRAGIVRLKGDWTQRDERITQLLAEHGRSGVPLYLYYPAGVAAAPTVLPQVLTAQTVLGVVMVSR